MRSLNPYCWLLYSNMRAEVTDFSRSTFFQDKYDIFHLHWPEADLNVRGAWGALAALAKKLLIIDLLRMRGTKVVWTIHNLRSHEQRHPKLERWFWKHFIRRLDGALALADSTLAAASEKWPALQSLPCFVVPHGHYRGEYPIDFSVDSRNKLGISPGGRVMLFFGQIRPYKGVEELVATFSALEDSDLELWIVGEARVGEYAERVKRVCEEDPRIHLDLRFIQPEEVQHFFRAADLVVLPYKNILNSGTALLALSFDRPVLVPNRGAMEELKQAVGGAWLRTYSGELDGAALGQALEWALQRSASDRAPLGKYEWEQVASRTLAAFGQICGRRDTA